MPFLTDRELRTLSDEELERRIQEMEKMSPDELAVDFSFGPGSMSGGAAAGADFDPERAPFQAEGDSFELTDIARAAGNIPSSLGNRLDEFKALAQDPGAALQGMGSLAKGVGKALFVRPDERQGDEDVALLSRMGDELKAQMTDRERLVEDPTAALANIASVAFPALKGAQFAAHSGRLANVAGKAAKAADVASDPVLAGARGAASAMGKGLPFAGRMGANLLGVTTGKGTGAINEALAAGLEGNRKPFLKAVKDKTVSEDTVLAITERLREQKKARGEAIKALRSEMRKNPQPIDIADVKDAIFGDDGLAADFGVTVRRAENGTPVDLDFSDSTISGSTVDSARTAAQSALQDLFNRPDQINTFQLDSIKKGLQSFSLSTSSEAEALVHGASKVLREKLYSDVPKYAETFQPFDEMQTFLEEMGQRINLNIDKDFTKAANAAVRNALNEGKDTELRAILRLEERFTPEGGTRSDIPIRAEIAGQQLSQDVPSGLVGREAFLGGVGGTIAAGAFIDPTFLTALVGLPLFSPLVVGKALAAAGAGAAKVAEVQQGIQRMLKAARVNNIPVSRSMTIGQLHERLTTGGKEDKKDTTGGEGF